MEEDNTEVEVAEDLNAPVEVADKPREPTAYEKRLRTEKAKLSARATAAEKTFIENEAKLRAEIERLTGEAKTSIEKAVGDATSAATQRVIRSELKAAALFAGMRDPSDVKLLDTSKLSLDEAGDLVLPENFFADLKKAKSYLFSDAAPSSATGYTTPPKAAPSPSTSPGKAASEMSKDEWAATLKNLGIRK